MRIGMVISVPIPPCEGIGFYVWNLSRYLIDQGHSIHIITRSQLKHPFREVIEGINVWRPPFVPLYPFHIYIHGIFVKKLIQEQATEFDLLHFHTPLVPSLYTKHPKLVTIHTPMRAESRSIPLDSFLGILVKLQEPVSFRIERRLFSQANRLVAVAQSVAGELKEYGVNPDQVAVLGNAIDSQIFFPSKHRKISANPYFLTVGRIGPRKGLDDLISCAKIVVESHPNVRFLIAGSGPLEKGLKRRIVRENLEDHIILLGHISDRQKLMELYQGATAYVHAAHYEGLPTVILESMACGSPVIATAVSGTLDVINDGQNGLLVPPRSPRKMAATILSLLDNPILGEKLAQAAIQTVQSRFTWKVVGRSYINEYEKLMGQ